MRICPEASCGGVGHRARRNRNSVVTRPRGEWTGRRYFFLRVCCASNAALGYLYTLGLRGSVLSRDDRADIIEG